MKNIQSNIIASDISTNLINHKVLMHSIEEQNNQAFKKAQFFEMLREEEAERKRIIKQEVDKKIKQNIKLYKEKKMEIEEINNKQQIDKIMRLQKKKELSIKLKENTVKINRKTNSNEEKTYNMTFKELVYIPEEENENFTFKEEKPCQDINSETKEIIPPTKIEKTVVNIREEIDNIIKSKLEESKIDKFDSNRASLYSAKTDLQEEIRKNVYSVKEFRKTGFIVDNNSNYNEMSLKMDESIVHNKKDKKFVNELERRRYIINKQVIQKH
jgi:hypothetical protein